MGYYEAMLRRIRTEFPKFKVVNRDDTWLRHPFRLLRKVTKSDYFNFVTTIGQTVYVGPGWKDRPDISKYKVLRHELVHLRQFRVFPFGASWRYLNLTLFAFFYLFVLPAFWTYRARFEREAYAQTLLVQYELEGAISDRDMGENTKRMVRIFTGPAYFWMARKKATYTWAMELQRKINRGEMVNNIDRITDLEAKRAP